MKRHAYVSCLATEQVALACTEENLDAMWLQVGADLSDRTADVDALTILGTRTERADFLRRLARAANAAADELSADTVEVPA